MLTTDKTESAIAEEYALRALLKALRLYYKTEEEENEDMKGGTHD